MSKPKYPRYQDYVIKDGHLVGEFEQMYRDYDDPWWQTTDESASDKALAIHLLRRLRVTRVMELGSGLGQFTANLAAAGFNVLGVDISPTAVEKARTRYPSCDFRVGDILDFEIYQSFTPQAIVMAEITWYVLDKLDAFLAFLKRTLPDVYVIHLLVTYPPGVQQHGADRFTTLPEIMRYFGMEYLEWGEIHQAHAETTKTFFLGRWPRRG